MIIIVVVAVAFAVAVVLLLNIIIRVLWADDMMHESTSIIV